MRRVRPRICDAGNLDCRAETPLGACQSVENSLTASLQAISSTAYCRALEKTAARERNCVKGGRSKRVDAEMSLGAAGKSACATKSTP